MKFSFWLIAALLAAVLLEGCGSMGYTPIKKGDTGVVIGKYIDSNSVTSKAAML